LVERDLAKVEVAGSSPVFRSKINPDLSGFFFYQRLRLLSFSSVYSGGGTGRHAGLKILFAVMRVTVQFRSRVQIKKATISCRFFYLCFLYLFVFIFNRSHYPSFLGITAFIYTQTIFVIIAPGKIIGTFFFGGNHFY
jgi:hypothetical protein